MRPRGIFNFGTIYKNNFCSQLILKTNNIQCKSNNQWLVTAFVHFTYQSQFTSQTIRKEETHQAPAHSSKILSGEIVMRHTTQPDTQNMRHGFVKDFLFFTQIFCTIRSSLPGDQQSTPRYLVSGSTWQQTYVIFNFTDELTVVKI